MNLKWHTEKRKIDDLVPYENNPRQMTEKQVENLKKSLEKFDLVEIPAIDIDNKIIAGHQRLKIMQILGRGEEEIDVRLPNRKLSDKEFGEYNLRSNKNVGEWDWDMLANFDMELLEEVGFVSEELDKFREVEEDEVPEVAEGEPIAKLGEIYQLGNHRLMCGDSTKIEDVEKLMNGQKADMVFTDPPYNIGYEYKSWDDKFTDDEYKQWYKDWMVMLRTFSKGNIVLTIGHANIGLWYEIDKPLAMASWIKRNAVTGSKIAKTSIWEPLLFFGEYKDKRDFDVFEHNLRRQDIGKTGKEHSCPKQVSLIADIVEHYSKTNDMWLDIFGGSGTTLIACEQLNRKCYMMELDCRYIQVILDRWSNLTGKDPIRLNDGKKWSEIKLAQ